MTVRVGMLARADQGGLGALCWEFSRHLRPERTLVIDLGPAGRGTARLNRYPGAWVCKGMDHNLPAALVRRLCREVDVLYTAETFYRHDVCEIARQEDCVTVLHAMPELCRADMVGPDVTWLPTTWEADRLPQGTGVVPVPVATDRLPYRQRTTARTFLHLAAPAMLDRNGTHLILDALPHVTHDIRLVLVGSSQRGARRIGRVTVDWVDEPVENYWQRFSDDIDVLLLPRRYAGLSLPMAEAAAAGIPTVSLDLPPQNTWLPPALLVSAHRARLARMVGGNFWVHDASPADLAARIDALAGDDDLTAQCSAAVGAHGAALSWDVWADVYARLLGEAAGQ